MRELNVLHHDRHPFRICDGFRFRMEATSTLARYYAAEVCVFEKPNEMCFCGLLYRQQCRCLPPILPVRKLRDVMLGRREPYEALPNLYPPSQVERQLANEQFRRALVLED